MKQLVHLMRILFFPLLLLWSLYFNPGNALANGGYRIEVEIENYDMDTLRLGYYFGKAQYLNDTTYYDKGKYIFEGDEILKPGVYLLVMSPDNKFFHILINGEEQHFSVSFDIHDMVQSAKFKGSPENDLYYDYLRQLDSRRPKADELRALIKTDSVNQQKYRDELSGIDADVRKLQDKIVKDHPGTLTAMLIVANQEIDVPEFTDLTDEEKQKKQYEYYRAHYFDHFDLADPRAIRTGLMQSKIDFFLQKLSFQVPDSQALSMDLLLRKMQPNEEAFQYYLVQFLNEAARSKRMGMDAVYVYLIDHYYSKGLAPWTEKEQLDKLLAQAESLRPTLIGKIAPDMTFYKETGEPISIHSIQSPYTVLFFWDPECGHCKKTIPFIIDFYNAYKDKGVEMLSICTKTGSDISGCWSAIKERGMDVWVNAADQYLKSRYKTVYDVKTTPQIFILNKDKEILVKKIAGEDLVRVMDEILKHNEGK